MYGPSWRSVSQSRYLSVSPLVWLLCLSLSFLPSLSISCSLSHSIKFSPISAGCESSVVGCGPGCRSVRHATCQAGHCVCLPGFLPQVNPKIIRYIDRTSDPKTLGHWKGNLLLIYHKKKSNDQTIIDNILVLCSSCPSPLRLPGHPCRQCNVTGMLLLLFLM